MKGDDGGFCVRGRGRGRGFELGPIGIYLHGVQVSLQRIFFVPWGGGVLLLLIQQDTFQCENAV